MRITLIGPAYPYKGGGARHTTELAHRLAARGHDVVIESWRAQYPAALYPGRQTIDVPEADLFAHTRHDLAWYRPDGWRRVGRRAGREADLVVAAVFSPVQVVPYLGILGGIGRRARTVALCHNVLPHERRRADVVLTRTLLRRVGTVLTHSPAQARLARALVRGTGADVRTATLPPHLPETGGERSGAVEPGATALPPHLPDAGEARSAAAEPGTDTGGKTDPAVATAGAGAPDADTGGETGRKVRHHLLFFGIVRPYKGVDVLLRALAAGAPASVTLTVAGEVWGGADDLRSLAAELGIAERVEFREGYVASAELPELFGAADAVVLPYRSATATQNVWLAHEHGLPVIATRAGTLADQVRDGIDGLLCAPGDPDDLARALAEFYTPGTPERLRAGVCPVDPEPYWDAYIEALTA
ncbi:glycosyltransferase family 4 protein [Nocardiopsis mangrovi]|uniref:Glycosyltransferase family 4 protein n=1 Tax=Nocardiopsis mangrovi TaxID=1179818 RepID=A0ABV9DPK7_9ACTN